MFINNGIRISDSLKVQLLCNLTEQMAFIFVKTIYHLPVAGDGLVEIMVSMFQECARCCHGDVI